VLYFIAPQMRFPCFVFLCDLDAHPSAVVVVPQSHENEGSSEGEGMHSQVFCLECATDATACFSRALVIWLR